MTEALVTSSLRKRAVLVEGKETILGGSTLKVRKTLQGSICGNMGGGSENKGNGDRRGDPMNKLSSMVLLDKVQIQQETRAFIAGDCSRGIKMPWRCQHIWTTRYLQQSFPL